MVKIKTTVKFEAAHRQLDDPSKCGFLHGHNWIVDIEIDGTAGPLGYVIDFKDLKEVLMVYDHKVLLKKGDPLIEVLREAGQRVEVLDVNPTCEELAVMFTRMFIGKVDNPAGISVRVWENDKSYGEYSI